MKKRIVSLFMALVMTLSLLPTAWAAELVRPAEDTTTPAEQSVPEEQRTDTELTEDNSFLLLAANNAKVIIAPERVPYTEGQTVKDALLALEAKGAHTFSGLAERDYVSAIDGIAAGYLRSDDKGGDKLDQSAGNVNAFLFLTAYDNLNEDTASALYALGRAMLAWQEAEKPQLQRFAQQEYDAAAQALTAKKTVEELNTLTKALTDRMDAYQQYENADVVPLGITFQGLDGQPLTNYRFTAEDPYGNQKRFTETDDAVALAPGDYTFTLTSGDNGASGTLAVAEDGAVSVAGQTLDALRVPQGVSWIGQPVLRSVSGGSAEENAYPTEDNGHTVLLPDTVGGKVGLYLYAVPGTSLDQQYQWEGSQVRVWAVYTDINGRQTELVRKWVSTQQALTDVVNSGTQDGQVRIEARAAVDGYTMRQAWELTLERTPTLSGLDVSAGSVDQSIGFASTKTDYACTVTTQNVVLRPACTGNYTITVNGKPLASDGTYTLALDTDTTAAEITVTMDSGRSTVYTLTVTRKEAVPLTVTHDTGVSVQIYNSAGAEIGKDDNGTYPLTPGDDSYTYIATKNTYYHTKGTFAAPTDGDTALTIAAVTPETEDHLTSLKLTSGTTNESDIYLDAADFKTAQHLYTAEIDDVHRVLFAAAAATEGQTIAVQRTDGKETVLENGKEDVSYIPKCITDGPETSPLTVNVSRQDEARGVTFYQEYRVDLTKVLTLSDAALSVDGTDTAIYQMKAGEITAKSIFDDEVYDYHATILGTAKTAALTLEVPFEGYSVTVDGVRYTPEADPDTGVVPDTVTVSLTLDNKKEQTVTFSACTESGKKAHTYTLTLKKGEPIATTITVTDLSGKAITGALAAVYDKRSSARVWPEADGTFQLVEGLSYTCVATCSGYVGQSLDIVAGTKNKSLSIQLEAAPDTHYGAGVTSDWPSFRGNDNSNGVVDVKTPISRENTVLSWANKLGEGYGSGAVSCPILIKEGGLEFLIVYSGTKLYKVESVTGTVVATGTMCDTSSFAINSATYGAEDGMLFVALSNGVVQAFDAATLQSLWIYHDPLGGQPNCPLTYHNGYVYTGFWNQEDLDANYVCLSATDEKTDSGSEEKLARWAYTSKGGFYWAGAYVCDDYLLVGTDDGKDQYFSNTASLLCLDPSTGAVLARWDDLAGDVRCSIARDKSTGLFYFTSKGGYLYSAAVEEGADGWAITQRRTCRLSNGSNNDSTPPMSTCTPVLYNGRAYIGVSGTSQFGAYSGHNITVVDLDSLSVLYSVPTKGYPQTSGLLTTAYDQGDGTAYVYFFDNFTPGILRMLEDKTGQSAASKTTVETYQVGEKTYSVDAAYALFTPANDQAQYAICSPITDGNGTLFFKNDSAHLMALTSTVQRIEVTKGPNKNSYTAGEPFDPTGMELTVYYDNGTSRTLPVSTTVNGVAVTYFTYNSTVSEEDGKEGFALSFAPVMYQSDGSGEPVDKAVDVFVTGITVAPQTYQRGDVNGDGAVDVYDLQYMYEHFSGINKIEDYIQLGRLDCNQDGRLNATDMQALYGFLTSGLWDVPSEAHVITVKDDAPKAAEVPQGQLYRLNMSDVFAACGHTVSYRLSGDDAGSQTKLVQDTDGTDYLAFTNRDTGEYQLTITAVCGNDGKVTASHTITVTVTPGDAGDERQYGYDETPADSVTVYVTISNDGAPIYGIDGTALSHLEVEVPYFDLAKQGLAGFYRCHTENGQGAYIDEEVVERPTLLHLYLYLLGVYCQGWDPEDVTEGYQQVLGSKSNYTADCYRDILGKEPWNDIGEFLTLNITGGPTSLYMQQFWGHDENLMYFRNHVYPLMGPGWGSTADYILLKDGDIIDLAMFSNWEFWNYGAFACFDADAYSLTAGETLTFKTQKYDTRSVADGGSESVQPVEGLAVYLCDTNWNRLAMLPPEDGNAYQYVFDKPGDYYLLAVDPNAGTSSACYAPATARVHVSAAG